MSGPPALPPGDEEAPAQPAGLGERVRTLVDAHVSEFVDVLGAQVAFWLAEDPKEFELDHTWSDAGMLVETGRSVRCSLGPDATVTDFLDARIYDEADFGSESGWTVRTWRDRLTEQFGGSLADRMAQIVVDHLGNPDTAATAGWAMPFRAPDPSALAISDPLVAWVDDDSGWHIGVEIEVVVDIDCFRRPLAILEAMTVSQVMERWGDEAEAAVAVAQAEEECRLSSAAVVYARRQQVVARWLPRFRLATGDRKKQFTRRDLDEVRDAFRRIGLAGGERWEFIVGSYLWTLALRDALLKAGDS